MNHPASQCVHFVDELVNISNILLPSRQSSEPSQLAEDDEIMHEPDHYDETSPHGNDSPSAAVWFSDAAKVSDSKYYVEAYPDASQVHGHGPTFLDLFDADVFAEYRRDNLYYPFASRKEWQLASFLLHSNLSMSAIDKFLSLQLVGLFLANQRTKLRLS